MSDVRCEGDVWALSLPQFIAHLRSGNPKTVIEDMRAADELECLRSELKQCRKEKNSLVLKAAPQMDALTRVKELLQTAEYENTAFTAYQIQAAIDEGA